MYPIYYTVIIAVSISALVGTIFIAKELTKQERHSSSEDDLKSLKKVGKSSSIQMLTVIYTITFVISVILIWIFIF